VIIGIALAPDAPLHLLLGSDAFKRASAKLDQLQSELRANAELTMSTDFASAKQCASA